MSERDEIAAPIKDAFYAARDEGRTMHQAAVEAADALIAANVRHLPSLVDDPEAVERVARKMCLGFTNDTKREAMAGYRIMASDLLRALAGGE